MTKTTEAPPAPRAADGKLTMQTDNHTFIMEFFFNHNSRETFQDKLLRVILAEEKEQTA